MTAILPDAAWRGRDGLATLAIVLGAGRDDSRFVGGAVRDTLLGLDVVDVDIATRHAPDHVIGLLKQADIRVVPTGLAHGTVTAVLTSGPVEITTLRRDVATDGRHATVAFTDDWREDAARRDFTINALYAELNTGRIHDYFGGLDDLARRRVRFIGDPLKRIAEDHLRILRFFRFMARFGDQADADGLAACSARANDLMALSRERIAAEVLKLLVAQDAVRVVTLMHAHAIFQPVLPEISERGIARITHIVAIEQAAELAPDPIRRLAALLPADPVIGEQVAARLKLSNHQRKRIASALVPFQDAADGLAYRIGVEAAIDRILISGIEPSDQLALVRRLLDWSVPKLPIGGGELVARGVTKGPEVAALLQRIEDQWIAEGFPDAARIEAITAANVDQWLRSSRN